MSFSHSYTENELLRLIAEGDKNAFTQIYNNYRNKIYSIAFDLTESTAVAEEIVQDVFLKIWVKRDSLNEVEHFRAYLFTITRNYVFTALKRIARKVLIDEICGLLRAQMRTGGQTVSQRFLVQCEERAIAVNTFDSPSTILTLGKMIA